MKILRYRPAPAFRSLPDELMQLISDRLEHKDLLNFRLVIRRTSEVGLTTLQERCRMLYLDNSRSSLQRFRDICDCPVLAKGILTIIYVARLDAIRWEKPDDEDMVSIYDEADLMGCPHEDADDLMNTYQARKLDQQRILEQGEVEAALMHAADSLHSLESIVWASRPEDIGWDGVDDHFGVANAYNRHRRWQRFGMQSGYPPNDSLSPRDRFANMLVWHGSTREDCDSPASVILAVASHAHRNPGKKLHLSFRRCTLNLLGDAFIAFAKSRRRTYRTALQHISRLTIDLMPPYSWTQDRDVLIRKFCNRWLKFIEKASHMQQLVIRGNEEHSEEAYHLLKRLMTASGDILPHLATLELRSDLVTRYGGRRFADRDWKHMYTTSELMDFIRRHRSGLKALKLQSASGVDPTTFKPTATHLQRLLEMIRSECTVLQSAKIEETFVIEDSFSNNELEKNGLEWERQHIDKSDLGQFAFHYGAKVSEYIIGRHEEGTSVCPDVYESEQDYNNRPAVLWSDLWHADYERRSVEVQAKQWRRYQEEDPGLPDREDVGEQEYLPHIRRKYVFEVSRGGDN
ncbi:hypothetical protein HII31_03204 [Pseudocercospora fuligena]|uniref:F-box domain-containing protein n=1 Tax=Pseudocercospora fuligena TaxID=685502 RepID=A0A8H6VM31_9PEZI|nr:hypothetical protein HII31_03204 [Pseudocercospora fuligena]